jgi:hypothetical protein
VRNVEILAEYVKTIGSDAQVSVAKEGDLVYYGIKMGV